MSEKANGGTAKSAVQQQPSRMRLRLLRHHLPLFALSAVSFAALYFTRPYKDVLTRASFATAYPALVFLSATLLIGPWNLLQRSRNPISIDLRRDLGIWAGILGILHTAIGQNVHLRGRPWLYYIYAAKERHQFPLRHDLFGLANYTGAISVLLLIALLGTSNDYSLRKLGTPQWKQLQRWNYAVFGLAVVHALAYQGIEQQFPPYVAAIIICLVGALCFQVAGFLTRRSAAKQKILDGRES
jgi:sulfoxide reductase heme-binding subunit YedZ